MSVSELLQELRQAVDGRPISYHSASAACDIYEGYIFGLVVRAAAAAGADVTYEDVQGNPATRLVFRTSPGMLHSTVHPYTHAVIRLPDCAPVEAHVGVRVQGRSQVLHECDVLVLPSDEATLARTRRVAPRGSRAVLAVECKYYASHLALHLGRGFHGLHTDLGLKHPFFVANIRAGSIERYLSYHNRRWENGVMPGTAEATYLEGLLRDAFKQHMAVRGAFVT